MSRTNFVHDLFTFHTGNVSFWAADVLLRGQTNTIVTEVYARIISICFPVMGARVGSVQAVIN